MRALLARILMAPAFLYRVEAGTAVPGRAGLYRLDDYEVGARLSYFLWSTMPDVELFAAVAANKLRVTADLKAQVARMLMAP